jgi:hypothetical protein
VSVSRLPSTAKAPPLVTQNGLSISLLRAVTTPGATEWMKKVSAP